jgi:phage/plasmid-like protein (TIGR03299 family)
MDAIAKTSTGADAFAYVGAPAWHRKGQELTKGASLEQWSIDSGMNFQVNRSRVRFGEGANQRIYEDKHVLFRSDTKAPLAVVSPGFHIVQPREVLSFFADIAGKRGAYLETAGVLHGGTHFWAMANMGLEDTIRGNDAIRCRLLLATAVDGSMRTTAKEIAERVVCANTLRVAMGEATKSIVRVSHRSVFDADAAKTKLGATNGAFAAFIAAGRALAQISVTRAKAEEFVAKLLLPTTTKTDPATTPGFAKIMALFQGAGMGSTMLSAQGTAWGLLNAVTEYVDHHARARSEDNRMDSAWFGPGEELKTRAFAMLTA